MPNGLGDPAHNTALSHDLWIPCEFPVPPVISMATRAAEVAVVCGMAAVSLRLGADVEVRQQKCSQGFAGQALGLPALPRALQAA